MNLLLIWPVLLNLAASQPEADVPVLPELPWTVIYSPGSEGCPSALQLKQRVYDRLHNFSPRAQQVVLRITFYRQLDKFIAHLESASAPGGRPANRELRSVKSTCDELGSAVVLALSVALSDEVLAANPAEPAGAPAQADEVNGQPFYDPTELRRFRPPRLNLWQLRLGGGAQLSFGSAPGVAPGFALLVGAERPHWSFDLEGRADIPASQLTPAGGQVSVAWYGASIVPCYRVRWFSGCVPVFLGTQLTQGLGVAADSHPTFVGAAGIRLAARAAATAASYVEFSVDLSFPWQRIAVDSFETLPVVTTLRLTFYGVLPLRRSRADN